MSQITLWPVLDPQWNDTKLITLQKILQAINDGGSGSGVQQVYQDRDPAAPDNPAFPAISYSSTTGVITQWNGAAWV